MKDLYIVGAGGFGREIQWLVERINLQQKEWHFCGYVDDGIEKGEQINGYPVFGGCEYLLSLDREASIAVAIGPSKTRKTVVKRLKGNKNLRFPNLIDPSVLTSSKCEYGMGNIICAGTVLTVNYHIGDFNIINLDCTVGHDVKISSYVTLYPSVNVSGCVTIGAMSEIGTGANIIQGIHIGEETIVGAGSVVVRNINGHCTAMGVPCRPVLQEKIERRFAQG